MTKNDDYRKYLEERFNGISTLVNAQFDSMDLLLKKIEDQTKKTNNRVTKLEDEVINIKSNINHVIDTRLDTCPKNKTIDNIEESIDEIKDNLGEYNIIKKYPKASIILIAVFVVSVVVSCITAVAAFTNVVSNKKIYNEIELVKNGNGQNQQK